MLKIIPSDSFSLIILRSDVPEPRTHLLRFDGGFD